MSTTATTLPTGFSVPVVAPSSRRPAPAPRVAFLTSSRDRATGRFAPNHRPVRPDSGAGSRADSRPACAPGAILRELLQARAPRWTARSIHVSTDLHDGDSIAAIDPSALRTAFGELIAHAERSVVSTRCPDIEVRSWIARNRVVFEVSDNGHGYDRREAAHIFDVAYSSQRSEFAGLGLPLARRLIEAHRGHLEVESSPGLGATFRVSLPRAAGAAPATSVRPTTQPRRALLVGPPGTLHHSSLRVLARTHELLYAESVSEGLRKLATRRIDLVFCDAAVSGGGASVFLETLRVVAPDLVPRTAIVADAASAPIAAPLANRHAVPLVRHRGRSTRPNAGFNPFRPPQSPVEHPA